VGRLPGQFLRRTELIKSRGSGIRHFLLHWNVFHMPLHEVIYPNSNFAGPDRVRINIIIGYSFSAISEIVRIDGLNMFSWMMDLDAWYC